MSGPNAHKSLPQLRGEWTNCVKCALGERRLSVGGSFVFGVGARRGVMFIGEGPGIEEEKLGVPFVGRSGRLLHTVLQSLKLEQYYISNIVSCRSCEARTDPRGNPIMRKNWQTKEMELVYQDCPPLPSYMAACLPRLYEEIYLVDPIVIVGLGATACEALLKTSVTITREHGETTYIEVPGAVHRPALTPGGKWARKALGVLHTPTEQNQVQYLFVPSLHPAFVLRSIQDKDARSWFQQFYADIAKAVRAYNAYIGTVLGTPPVPPEVPDGDAVWESYLKTLEMEENG